jgi:hypothetical protein
LSITKKYVYSLSSGFDIGRRDFLGADFRQGITKQFLRLPMAKRSNPAYYGPEIPGWGKRKAQTAWANEE